MFACALLLARAGVAADLPFQSPDGRRTVTAVESRTPITLDGALDEEVWRIAVPAAEFLQAEPHEGQPATELTEVRLAFDREALYIGVVCHSSDPASLIINDIRKDFVAGEQDSFEIILNTSWDAVWTVATRRDASGWSAELRIPFKTLRFESGSGRIWGVNFSRRIRGKNEIDYWSPVPRVYNLYRAGLAGTLTGLPDASQGRNLRIKPWIAADSTRALAAKEFDADVHAGLDIKYGVTPSLTLDVTAKPDFAQAEADEQQVNLTQFSLFFPEKREFFLENSGMFYFGDIPRESRLGNARFAPPEEEMLLFFSRRIGLTSSGEEIPIAAGGRLTGRAGRTGVGLMTIQTQSDNGRDGDNYTVLRGRRDILRNSDIGAIFLSRQSSGASDDRNEVAGVDANFRFIRALSLNGFLAKSFTPGVSGGDMSGKGSIVWNDNFLHTQYSLLSVGDNFRDDIGFIKRTGSRKHFVDFGIRFRPEWWRKFGIRELHPHTRYNIYTDQSNVKVLRADHRAVQGPHGSIVRTGPVRLERIRVGAGNEPQQEGLGFGAADHRRILERHAEVDEGRDHLPAVLSSDVRYGAAAQRHRSAVSDARVRHQPRDVAHRLRVQHADVPRHAAAVQHGPEADERQRPLRSDSPSPERSVRCLQRAAADGSAHAGQHRPRADRQIHAHARLLDWVIGNLVIG